MARFRKAVLRTGTYHSPDGDVPVTRERLAHWREEFGRMKAARQVVPVDWDHAEQSNREGLTPLSLADFRKRRSAKNTVGHLVDFECTDAGAILTLDVPDDTAADKADKNLVFVSPVISPTWRDSAKNDYADCITHVDFVNHPVDHNQGPFERVPTEQVNQQPAIACALRMGLGTQFYTPLNKRITRMAATKDKIVIRMGEGEPANGFFMKAGKPIPITAGGAEYLDSADDKDKTLPQPSKPSKKWKSRQSASRKQRKAGKNAASKLSLIRMAEGEPTQTADVIPEEDYDNVDEILDLLEEFNIRLPDDTTDENLVERLRAALHTAVAHKEDAEDTAPTEPIPETPQAMSLAAYHHANTEHRHGLVKRVAALHATGRCTGDEKDKALRDIATVRLSIAKNTPIKSETERWIESREVVPEGAFLSEAQRLSLGQPKSTETPEKVKGVLERVFHRR